MTKSTAARICIPILFLLVLTGGLSAQLLDGPESIVFDSLNDRYLVSNWASGDVVAIDLEGNQTMFAQLSQMILGNCIKDNTFYTAWGSGSAHVMGLDLTTRLEVFNVNIIGVTQIDGMTTDTSGYLYTVASRTSAGIIGRVYRVNLSTGAYDLFADAGIPTRTQAVTFDAVNNRLLVVGFDTPSSIVAVSLPDGVVSDFVAEENSPGNFDGIAIDQDGYVYTSVYSSGLVLQWEPDGSSSKWVAWSQHGPAGIDYNWRDKILAIPQVNSDNITYIHLGDPDNDGLRSYIDNCPDAYNPGQEDADNDIIGDACDECTDTDYDGYGDPGFAANTCTEDNCPDLPNGDQGDLDADGVGNECDNCLFLYNPDQVDNDLNGIGDACEGCCLGRVGDVNGVGGDEPTIGDISTLIDAKFISGICEGNIDCLAEADINQSGGTDPTCDDVTVGDISGLIDYLFITGTSLGLSDCL